MRLFWNLIWRMDRWDQRKYFIPWTWSNPNKNIIEELQLLNNLHFLNEIYLLFIFALNNFKEILKIFTTFICRKTPTLPTLFPSDIFFLNTFSTEKENLLNMRKNIILWSTLCCYEASAPRLAFTVLFTPLRQPKCRDAHYTALVMISQLICYTYSTYIFTYIHAGAKKVIHHLLHNAWRYSLKFQIFLKKCN